MGEKDFAVIFDMDGVIVDNNSFHEIAWKQFCKNHNCELSDEDLKFNVNGRKGPDILRYLFGKGLTNKKIEELADEKEKIYRKTFEGHVVPVDGLIDFLEMLQTEKVKRVLATSARPKNIGFILEKTGTKKYFEEIVDATQTSKGKPNPEVFLKAAERMKMNPNRCIVIEDSLAGIQAAKSAGMKVIAIATSHPKEDLKEADLVAEDFTHLGLNSLVLLANKRL